MDGSETFVLSMAALGMGGALIGVILQFLSSLGARGCNGPCQCERDVLLPQNAQLDTSPSPARNEKWSSSKHATEKMHVQEKHAT